LNSSSYIGVIARNKNTSRLIASKVLSFENWRRGIAYINNFKTLSGYIDIIAGNKNTISICFVTSFENWRRGVAYINN